MASVVVERRAESVEAVATALESWAPTIGAEMQRLLTPHLREGESFADPGVWPLLLARHLRASLPSLQAADTAHEAEQGDDALPRDARDVAQEALYRVMLRGRERLRGAFGSEAVARMGQAGTTPRDGAALAAQAGQLLTALSQPTLPPLLDARDAHVVPGVREDVTAALAALRAAQAEVTREARELTAASALRNTELARHDLVFTQVAGLGSAMLRVANQDALADRLRPSLRRRGLTADLAADGPDAPADDPSPAG